MNATQISLHIDRGHGHMIQTVVTLEYLWNYRNFIAIPVNEAW